jgi:signal transduction histidine kinase
MDSAANNESPEPHLAEHLVRTLRHEIGDFLQTVYSTAAILQARLPAGQGLERTIVANLLARAEVCKHLLDTVHDIVLPLPLAPESVRLADLAKKLAVAAAARYPHLDVRAETEETRPLQGDGQRLLLVGNWLLENACQSATGQVRIRTVAGPGPDEVSWIVTDDGPGLSAEQLGHLFDTFTLSRRGTLGLGLGAVRRMVQQHGGQVEAAEQPTGGLTVRVVLPREQPESAA